MDIYYKDQWVGHINTNMSLTLAGALDLIGFNEQDFIAYFGYWEGLDYTQFRLERKNNG